MFRLRLLSIFVVFIACVYCGKDFQSVGRHSWRCKKKLHNVDEQGDSGNITLQRDSESNGACMVVKCSCGRECKGMKGLKMHQRKCRINDSTDVCQPPVFENSNIDPRVVSYEEEEVTVDSLDTFVLKPGVKLPKSHEQWIEADTYFRSIFANIKLKSDSLDQTIRFINGSIYDFFKTNYGTIKSTNQTDNNFHKYKDLTTKQLKKELAQLKHRGAAISDIKYVSRLLRSKLNNIPGSANNYTVSDNYDRHIGRNFGILSRMYSRKVSILPSFSRDHCTRFFLHLYREFIPHRTFTRPTWIPSLPGPSIPFSQSPPSYEKVTNVIRRMKSSGSPCPLDKISIICFKRCPYLRSLLTDIIRVIWESGHIPAEWKKACTFLVH